MASCRACKPRNLSPEGKIDDRLFVYLSEEAWNGKLSRSVHLQECWEKHSFPPEILLVMEWVVVAQCEPKSTI